MTVQQIHAMINPIAEGWTKGAEKAKPYIEKYYCEEEIDNMRVDAARGIIYLIEDDLNHPIIILDETGEIHFGQHLLFRMWAEADRTEKFIKMFL